MAKTSHKCSMKIPWKTTLLVVCLIAVLCLSSLVDAADDDKGDDKADDKGDDKKGDDKKAEDKKADDKKADDKKGDDKKGDDKKEDDKKKDDDKADDKKKDDDKADDEKKDGEKADDEKKDGDKADDEKTDDDKADDKKKDDDKKGDDGYDEFGDPKTPGSDSGSSLFGTPDAGGGGDGKGGPPQIPKSVKTCNGIYISYNFMGREKEYPHVRNVTAQSWAFKAQVGLVNMGATELKSWKMFIGFHHNELLVSLDGATLAEGADFPAEVGANGTTISGYPNTDLKSAIQTAGDYNQMTAQVGIKGTMFGLKPPATPLPKTIRLDNEGFKCPPPIRHKTNMYACCRKDPKFKPKNTTVKFTTKRYGDLNIMYDVLQAYGNNYQAQVTINNDNPLGRLDHWNLTWEWMRGEFIYSMRGAYTHLKDAAQCIYGPQGQYYQDFDFSNVMNCQRKPVISDLPREMKNDDKLGKLPYCCRNGTILPKTMNESESRSIFQLQVFKVPPDLNRTAIYPPQNWRFSGVLNPLYKCSAPVRVEPTEFPDPSGLQAKVLAAASWQIVCNITKPKERENRCCVTLSAFYNDSIVPCNTCACGCENLPEGTRCSAKAPAMLLPSEALLVPFENRTKKAEAWAGIKHYPIWDPMPCPDNCRVSINWHVDADYKNGWTARMTLFNWGDIPFENWFTAIQMKNKAGEGYEKVYSFNCTLLKNHNNTVFMQGIEGLNYLIAITNGSKPSEPRVPGKQQSVISFTKKLTWNLDIPGGDGFPAKVFFNGEECALPKTIPTKGAGNQSYRANGVMTLILTSIIAFFLTTDRFR